MSGPPPHGPAQPACHVCRNPITDTNHAACNTCDRPFHLRLRQDAPGPDCGDASINEHHLALEFACFPCLGVTPAANTPPEPPVGSLH